MDIRKLLNNDEGDGKDEADEGTEDKDDEEGGDEGMDDEDEEGGELYDKEEDFLYNLSNNTIAKVGKFYISSINDCS